MKSLQNNQDTQLSLNSLQLLELGIHLTEGETITIEFEVQADVQVKGVYTLEELKELSSEELQEGLPELDKALIEEGYELDESFEPQPVFQTILNIIERQTHTRFFLKKKVSETYVLKFGEYVDFDGDTRYGWYLKEAIENTTGDSFVRPLTKEFIGLYLLSKEVRGE